jgi:hypothetical protein
METKNLLLITVIVMLGATNTIAQEAKLSVKEDDKTIYKSATADKKSSIDYNSDWVLINGVKWATHNVGEPGTFVANPEDYGEYFQWNLSTISLLYDLLSNGSSSTWYSANDPSPTGYRVPTMEEIQSLTNSSSVTYEWTTRNGVWGGKFTDKKNGNSIFLPAAGIQNSNGSSSDFGKKGQYWTKNGNIQGRPKDANFLYFYDGFAYWNNFTQKSIGLSVRPVSTDTSSTGIEDIKQANAPRVYVNDNCIYFKNVSEKYTAEICDIAGRLYDRMTVSSDMNKAVNEPGIYIVKLKNDKQLYTYKLIIR